MTTNRLSINNHDRSSIKRQDQKWLADKFNNDKSRIIPIYNSAVLCEKAKKNKAVFINPNKSYNFPFSIESSIFLGIHDGITYFAVAVNSDEQALSLSRQSNSIFRDLKLLIPVLDYDTFTLLSLARFMVYWNLRNKYCGKCGHEMKSSEAGHVRKCQNSLCNEHFFPSMDPAIIVLIVSGNRCLLGRQKEWRKGMYSTLAGFVEPGETIEAAVSREVKEEVGINVREIIYQHSQAWLFPNSLMVGFTAIAEEETITLDNNELDDACWFTKSEIKSNPSLLPPNNSIATKLLTEWLEKDDK
jgi:NAD+ diphosphatase